MRDYRDEDHLVEWARQAIDDREELMAQDFRYNNRYRCETCKWMCYSEVDDETVCMNRMSDYCAECVGDYDTCEEWEKKDDDRR